MNGRRVMIIDDQAAGRDYLARIIRHDNLEPETCPDAASGVRALSDDPDRFILVISRLQLPDGNALSLMREIGAKLSPPPPFIVVTRRATRKEIIRAFRHGVLDFFEEPFDPKEIGAALERVKRQAEKRPRELMAYRCLRRKELGFEIHNDIRLVQPLIRVLAGEIGAACGVSGSRLNGLMMGINELLVNAIEHCNLEISSALKERPDYLEFMRHRARTEPYRSRLVTLECRIDPRGFSCTIRDQGPGFDWRNRPHPASPGNRDKVHGRGLVMAENFFDEIVFNDRGNEVTVRKTFAPEKPETATTGPLPPEKSEPEKSNPEKS